MVRLVTEASVILLSTWGELNNSSSIGLRNSKKCHWNFSGPIGFWVINRNHILNVWSVTQEPLATKISMPFLSFLDNLLQGNHYFSLQVLMILRQRTNWKHTQFQFGVQFFLKGILLLVQDNRLNRNVFLLLRATTSKHSFVSIVFTTFYCTALTS